MSPTVKLPLPSRSVQTLAIRKVAFVNTSCVEGNSLQRIRIYQSHQNPTRVPLRSVARTRACSGSPFPMYSHQWWPSQKFQLSKWVSWRWRYGQYQGAWLVGDNVVDTSRQKNIAILYVIIIYTNVQFRSNRYRNGLGSTPAPHRRCQLGKPLSRCCSLSSQDFVKHKRTTICRSDMRRYLIWASSHFLPYIGLI